MPQTYIIIGDTAVELIPSEIRKEEDIIKSAKKRGKKPNNILLDSSYHYKSMKKIKKPKKRGRPDILHVCLLNILGMPFVKKNKNTIKIIIHTINDVIIEISPNTRIPKNYNRFVGLIEQLFIKKEIKTEKESLLKILDKSLNEIITPITKNNRFIFSRKGKYVDIQKFFNKLKFKDIALIFGGYAHGSFSKKITNISDNLISISKYSLEAWIVINQIVYERGKTLE